MVVTCGKCKLNRLIDFLTRLAIFCGIAFIGDIDGEVEVEDEDSEGAFAPLVDAADDVVDTEDEWEWWLGIKPDIERTERSETVLRRAFDSGLILVGLEGGEGVASDGMESDEDEFVESDGLGIGTDTGFDADDIELGLFLEEGSDRVNGLCLRNLLGVLNVAGFSSPPSLALFACGKSASVLTSLFKAEDNGSEKCLVIFAEGLGNVEYVEVTTELLFGIKRG